MPSTCTIRTATGGVCGKPAVHTFTTSRGDTFAECADHHIATSDAALLVGATVTVRHAGTAKTGTVRKVTATRAHVELPVKPHGRPATTRVVAFAKDEVSAR
jgi:hypothetical protein